MNETKAECRCPVMGRLMVGRSESVFSAKILAPLSLWISGRARGKSAEVVEIDRQLNEYHASTFAIYHELSAVSERVMAEEIECLLLGMASRQETLLDYFRSFIEHFKKRVGVNHSARSVKMYRSTYNHIECFLSERLRLSDIPFTTLNRSFVDKFDLYLHTERHLVLRTVLVNMSRLHTVVNKAIATGIITADTFGVFTSAVSANIRTILKSCILDEDRVFCRSRSRNGNLVERYSLEMIIALEFRLKSEKAEVFRRWIVEQMRNLQSCGRYR